MIVLTPGMGIGPEVALRTLAQGDPSGVVLVGRAAAIHAANTELGLGLRLVQQLEPSTPGAITVLDPGDAIEPAEVAAIRLGAQACLDGRAGALVTGPIHKARLVAQGFAFKGHTDFLGALCGADAVMAFAGGRLRVALVTHHIPLSAVPGALTVHGIQHVVRTVGAALRQDLGIDAPQIAVCGLNPHAGEQGLLGTEEIEIIGPACAGLRAEGWQVQGPVSAETAFLLAGQSRADVVVAMFHDQGLAPLKAVDFGRSVNWTLGLPMVRTSVDHGTADHLVGTGTADPASMGAALALARDIVGRRARPQGWSNKANTPA